MRLKKIEASLRVEIPQVMLERLGLKQGDEVLAFETPSGYNICAPSLAVRKQVEAGEVLMDHHDAVFGDLAKKKP